MKKKYITKRNALLVGKSFFWFCIGIALGLFFTISFCYIIFQRIFGNTVYPGIYINQTNFGGKTETQVSSYFEKKNQQLQQSTFTFVYKDSTATISATKLQAGYNSNLLAYQVFSIGRSQYILSDIVLVFRAYLSGVSLSPSFSYSQEQLQSVLAPFAQKIAVTPVDAIFTFQNGRVTTFHPSSNGQAIDVNAIKAEIENSLPTLTATNTAQNITITIPVQILKPKVATADANNLGVKELIGTGTSVFQHSIPGRIFNVTLAASKLNGVLIAPNEEFSFDKALGDVSAFTGYQQAYVIVNGKTVLGDGGGVCQVSTTMFRAILNAGLPITERHGHAYRVGYYEEDGPPGIDATVYVPSVDLKFRNDTGSSILVQTVVDPNTLRLTFYLYGTNDGRATQMTQPTITNQTPAPPPLYTDDPTLPIGVIKQTDFAAMGARTEFSRTVTRNGKVLIQETYVTNYQPWQAAYLKGTKQ